MFDAVTPGARSDYPMIRITLDSIGILDEIDDVADLLARPLSASISTAEVVTEEVMWCPSQHCS